jgi:hypothetical protein
MGINNEKKLKDLDNNIEFSSKRKCQLGVGWKKKYVNTRYKEKIP